MLLAPAYHCLTMLDPAQNLGADVLLYPLRGDLAPDFAGLQKLLQDSTRPVKALLATHFFGFAQDFSGLKEWCAENGIVLVEDCSHAMFTEDFQAAGVGIYGDFVIASPYKFFPCADGGLLFARESARLIDVRTESPSLADELRGVWSLLRGAFAGNGSPCALAQIDARLAEFAGQRILAAEERIEQYRVSHRFSRNETRKSSLRSSRLTVRTARCEDISRRRRAHYQRWVAGVATLPHCRVLFPQLPAECTPYMLPLYIAQPEPIFYWLKRLGFPIWRWDEMAVSDCPVAADYRLHLLHLPCHQSLSDAQMEWMLGTLKKTLGQALRGQK